MHSKVEETLNSILDCESVEDLEKLLPEIADEAGFIGITYADITRIPLQSEVVPYFRTTVKKDFTAAYLDEGFAGVDPIVRQAAASSKPFHWKDCEGYLKGHVRNPGVKRKVTVLADLAQEFGYDDGYVIPCHSLSGAGHLDSGLFSFFGKIDSPRNPLAHSLRLTAMYYHEKISEKLREKTGLVLPVISEVDLTDREQEVLIWASRGKTNGEIGDILRITERTVKFHLAHAMEKLGVYNKVHAVALAMRLGLITP
ncbi:MAG: LuxR C-terminal-related transcriptional regulator [Rhodospirillaceae bacterium]